MSGDQESELIWLARTSGERPSELFWQKLTWEQGGSTRFGGSRVML